MRIFAGEDIRKYFAYQVNRLDQEIQKEQANKLLNVNEDQYAEYLTQKYSIDRIEFHWDNAYLTEYEGSIPAEEFPSEFNVFGGKKYPKQVVVFHIPISGEQNLLNYRPTSWLMWSADVSTKTNEISFEIVNWRDNAEEIQEKYQSFKNNTTRHAETINKDVAEFNAGLLDHANTVISKRKKEHLGRLNTLEAIGVPIKKSGNTPETFSIPPIKKRTLINKPQTSDKAFKPEPALDEETYRSIIGVCREVGIEMERHPSIYADKDEETLRDHFLMILSTHFESATGETFNRNGKTDILIRHEKSNIFVGECKFWRGEKSLTKAIDQLLGYLTWRDSKTAILMFIRNKHLDPILEKITPTVEQHCCYVRALEGQTQGCSEFKFHLLDDPTRTVNLTVLCFHIPEVQILAYS
jgi:hypothetical protein